MKCYINIKVHFHFIFRLMFKHFPFLKTKPKKNLKNKILKNENDETNIQFF